MPQFQILDAGTREPIAGLVFNDGGLAAAYVKQNNQAPDRPKLRVDRVPEPDIPDANGFNNGTYKATPWRGEHWDMPAHYAHLVKDGDAPSQVKFIDPDTSRWATCNPGRYLARFFPRQNVEEWAQRIDAPPVEFKYAVTADEMIDVYQSGPPSCMTKSPGGDGDDDDDEYFDTDIHPVTAYAGFDLQLAYLEDTGGKVYARVLVWPGAKKYGRIYVGYKSKSISGSTTRHWDQAIKDTFAGMGYTKGLTGARMTLIREGGCLICPYIDDVHCVTIMDDGRLLLGDVDGGTVVSAGNTNGYSDGIPDTVSCDRCLVRVSEYRTVRVDGEDWCRSCADNHATSTNSGYTTGPVVEVHNRGTYSLRYLEENDYSFKQLADGRWFHRIDVPRGAALMENVS